MQLTVRMPDEHMSRIEHIAKKMGLKKSDVTRIAIKKFVEEFAEETEERPFAKVQHLLGVAESGIPDLGQRHRDYMTKRIKAGC